MKNLALCIVSLYLLLPEQAMAYDFASSTQLSYGSTLSSTSSSTSLYSPFNSGFSSGSTLSYGSTLSPSTTLSYGSYNNWGGSTLYNTYNIMPSTTSLSYGSLAPSSTYNPSLGSFNTFSSPYTLGVSITDKLNSWQEEQRQRSQEVWDQIRKEQLQRDLDYALAQTLAQQEEAKRLAAEAAALLPSSVRDLYYFGDLNEVSKNGSAGLQIDNPDVFDPRREAQHWQESGTERLNEFSPYYNQSAGTDELRIHLEARELAFDVGFQVRNSCQSNCNSALNLASSVQNEKMEYYNLIVENGVSFGDSTSLATGPLDAFSRLKESEMSVPLQENIALLDGDFRQGLIEVYLPTDPLPIDRENLLNIQKLGVDSSIIVTTSRQKLDAYLQIDSSQMDQPPVGVNYRWPGAAGGISIMVTPDLFSGNANQNDIDQARRTMVHEAYHAGERTLISTAEKMKSGELPKDLAVMAAADLASLINNITQADQSQPMVSAAPLINNDRSIQEMLKQPGTRSGTPRNYTNTFIEARAFISEGVVGRDDSYWKETIKSDYSINDEDAGRVINAFRNNQTLAKIMNIMEVGAGNLIKPTVQASTISSTTQQSTYDPGMDK